MSSVAIASEGECGAGRPVTRDPRSCRLLLAEDDTATRALLALGLRREGYEVVEAGNGIELLTHLEAQVATDAPPFDAIISDVYMPGLGGFDVLAAVYCACWPTPFIVMTAFADQGTYDEARALGAAKVVEKPCSLGTLEAAVREVIAPA